MQVFRNEALSKQDVSVEGKTRSGNRLLFFSSNFAIRYNYSLPGGRERRIEEAKKEIPLLQQKIQDLHNQLQNVKLSEAT